MRWALKNRNIRRFGHRNAGHRNGNASPGPGQRRCALWVLTCAPQVVPTAALRLFIYSTQASHSQLFFNRKPLCCFVLASAHTKALAPRLCTVPRLPCRRNAAAAARDRRGELQQKCGARPTGSWCTEAPGQAAPQAGRRAASGANAPRRTKRGKGGTSSGPGAG